MRIDGLGGGECYRWLHGAQDCQTYHECYSHKTPTVTRHCYLSKTRTMLLISNYLDDFNIIDVILIK